jgi:hypothetical protein
VMASGTILVIAFLQRKFSQLKQGIKD